VQYSTATAMTTSLGALREVSVQSKEDTVMVREMSKSYVTSNPVKLQWYERFLSGMYKRMGDKVKHDEAIFSIEQMIGLMEILEEAWQKNMGNGNRMHNQVGDILFPALFWIVAYCRALKGEEPP
jgi:hypothetical protein